MSFTEAYLLAGKARTKLARAASKPDHDLRVLVAHANLLDNILDTLSSRRSSLRSSQPQTVSFNIPEEHLPSSQLSVTIEEEEVVSDSDSDSESDSDCGIEADEDDEWEEFDNESPENDNSNVVEYIDEVSSTPNYTYIKDGDLSNGLLPSFTTNNLKGSEDSRNCRTLPVINEDDFENDLDDLSDEEDIIIDTIHQDDDDDEHYTLTEVPSLTESNSDNDSSDEEEEDDDEGEDKEYHYKDTKRYIGTHTDLKTYYEPHQIQNPLIAV